MPLNAGVFNILDTKSPERLAELFNPTRIAEQKNNLADLANQRELRSQQVTQGRNELAAYPQQQADAKSKRLFEQQTHIGEVLTKLQQSIAMGNVSDEAIKQQAAQAKQFGIPDAIIQQTFGSYLQTPAGQRAAIAQGHVTDYSKWFETNNPKPVFSETGGGFVTPPNAQNPTGKIVVPAGFTPKQNVRDFNQPFLPDGTPNKAYQDYQRSLKPAGENQPLVAVMRDGKPVMLPRSQAVGLPPANQQALAPLKPLPAPVLKMQQDELDAIGTASGINADLGAIGKQLESGKLKLSYAENLKSRVKNQNLPLMSGSDENSRNFSTFQATLEKLRNDSLRLNKGVQTDGDAQRAWNELMANINDGGVVKQRLGEIQKLNERAVQLRKLNIDNVRANYGHESLDVSGYQNLAPAVGGSGGDIHSQADAILNRK